MQYQTGNQGKTDSSEWLLHPQDFEGISRRLGSPKIDLFAFCLCRPANLEQK